jgi:TonB family protein
MRARVRLQTDENAKKRAAARRASQPRRAQRAQSAQRRKQRRTYKLKIYPHKRQLQKLFAEKWQKEYEKNKDAQRRKKSGQASRHPAAKRWRKIKAAIENYVAEVKPGRATALRTRHHPFAKYIAAAHRNIHPLWGDGILNDWAEKPRKHPFNDRSRWAKVEMVINPDGTLHKAGLVKSSGYLPYDAAALDVVFTAAPYPRAPKKILSADKKVYLHWRFHRDHRQCGTFGVDAYILKNPTQKQTTDRAYARARNNRVRWDPARSFKRLHRRLGRNKGRLYRTATGKRSGYVAPARRSKRSGANAVEPEGDATDSTDSSRSGPQGKKRSRPSTEPRDRSSTRPRARPRTRSVKPATHGGNALFAQVAAAWLRAVGRGKRGVLEHLSALPFRSNSGVIARNPRQLRRALKSLLADGKETKPPRPAARFHLFTPAELRRYLKTLPSGLKTSPDERYAVGTLDGRRIILVLGHRDGAKRVVGLFR